ncbi:unnamed protein product, partial [Ixodes persulcatus]
AGKWSCLPFAESCRCTGDYRIVNHVYSEAVGCRRLSQYRCVSVDQGFATRSLCRQKCGLHKRAKTIIWDDFRGTMEDSEKKGTVELTRAMTEAAAKATVRTTVDKNAPTPERRWLGLWGCRAKCLRRYTLQRR